MTNNNSKSEMQLMQEDKNPSSDDMSLGKVPPKSERLKDSEGLKISKLCGETDWQPRFLAITATDIIIAHPGHEEISDKIPLVYCILFLFTTRP